MRPPLVVWQFTDGKPGHESQTRGLIAALKRRTDIHAYPIPVETCRCGVGSLLRRRHPCKTDYPPPDLILACGRATHFAALAARRACGGKLVSVMKPPLPARLYDLCLIPEHDGVPAGPGIVLTRGVMNPVVRTPMTPERHGRGLFLIGGPSAHHGWNGPQLVDTILDAVARDPARRWTLTTSRRTPDDFVPAMATRAGEHPRLAIVPASETPPGWVAGQLSQSDAAVVTEDSVSMVYESLTAGVAVSLLSMPRKGRSRVMTGVEKLEADHLVSPIHDLLTGEAHRNSRPGLAEADRCAELLLDRWPRLVTKAA
ncbi:MAG TPA: mitochondrial fission ELM1 family protein [Caulifigura sp.]|nr:mitochondrial fission ELM1 family protein [Caulifigura sp.]